MGCCTWFGHMSTGTSCTQRHAYCKIHLGMEWKNPNKVHIFFPFLQTSPHQEGCDSYVSPSSRISTTVNNSEALVSHQQLLNFYCQSSKPDIVRSPSYPVTSKFYQESLIKVIPLDAFLICEQLRWGALDLQVCQSSEVDT